MTDLHIGTSAFTASGWETAFYPAGMKPADYLAYYASRFDTVEVDSTFYATPSASTVAGWARNTPDNFVFALKVPQSITHQKVLIDCDDEFKNFLAVAELLSDLGSGQCYSSSAISIARSSRPGHNSSLA